jgi:hypothetical protein
MPRQSKHDLITKAYTKPGHPTAFSAPGAVSRHFIGVNPAEAKKALENVDSYVLHREYKRPSVFNPYYIYERRHLVQGDLIEMRNLSTENDGVNYLLLLIDVFTRRVWVYPMQRKTGKETADALNKWLRDDVGSVKPKTFSTDSGREFFNVDVRRVLHMYNVDQHRAAGTSKAAYAERANKTLQILIYKYLTEKETERYINVLPKLVRTYNLRGHRSLDYLSPNEADQPRNEVRVRAIAMAKRAKIKKKRPKFKLGEVVRIKTDSKQIVSSRRAYAEQYHEEYFTIIRVNRRLPIPMYYLKSMDSADIIEEGFYSNELSRVRGDIFKLDKDHVITYRGRGRNKQAYVKWKSFGPQHNSWILASRIHAI